MVLILPPGSFSVSQDWFCSFEFGQIDVWSPRRFYLRSSFVFPLYNTLSQVIRKYTAVKYHFYADETQLFIYLSPEDCFKSIDRLKSCLNNIQVWMSDNKLKLNPDQTEFIVFGAKD